MFLGSNLEVNGGKIEVDVDVQGILQSGHKHGLSQPFIQSFISKILSNNLCDLAKTPFQKTYGIYCKTKKGFICNDETMAFDRIDAETLYVQKEIIRREEDPIQNSLSGCCYI